MDDIKHSSLNHLYSSYKNIGFITPYLSGCQSALNLLDAINKEVETHPYDEICIYNIGKDLPILTANCAIYTQLDIRDHDGPLVAIDPISYQSLTIFYTGPKYYYIYDVLLLKYIPPTEIDKMRKSGVKYFTRSDDHAKFLKKNFGLDILPIRVPDFDIEKIKEIVHDGY